MHVPGAEITPATPTGRHPPPSWATSQALGPHRTHLSPLVGGGEAFHVTCTFLIIMEVNVLLYFIVQLFPRQEVSHFVL